MLVVMVGLLSGALWWEGWGATSSNQQQPRAAQESPGELGELWGISGRAQGDPEHPKHDTFPGDSGLQVSLANLVPQARGHPKSSKSAR